LLEIVFEVDSTNSRLLAASPPPYGAAHVCICELQSAGRGRRGRRWIAPFGASVAMSLAWAFRDAARDLPALSLAVGVAVARALARVGAQGVRLKWPNDLWFEDRKIGGVLIDLRAEAGGPRTSSSGSESMSRCRPMRAAKSRRAAARANRSRRGFLPGRRIATVAKSDRRRHDRRAIAYADGSSSARVSRHCAKPGARSTRCMGAPCGS
jgi:hypothetical protein